MTRSAPERRLPPPERVAEQITRLNRALIQLYLLGEQVLVGYEEAYDASLSQGSASNITLGRGFNESDPTGQVALSPQRRELRWRARRAASRAEHAVADLEEAQVYLTDGMLQLDPEEWIRVTVKRTALGP